MEAVGPISRKKTMNEHTKSMLWMITVFYFLNMAAVPPLLQFDLNIPALNFFGLLQGQYRDFSPEWYRIIGSQLCFTMFLGMFIPHFSEFPFWGMA